MNDARRHSGVPAGRVSVFSGASMPEVLTRIRSELGPDAVILQARYVRPRGWFGSGNPTVEITAARPAQAASAANQGSRGAAATVFQELAELRGLVKRLIERGSVPGETRSQPKAMKELADALSAQGLPEGLVKALGERVFESFDDASAVEWPAARAEALKLLARMMPVSGPVGFSGLQATRIALVGPTGVGKTTTIAKLAALLKIKERRSVGFVAADTFRIAAVDQLKRYAELLEAPVETARTPEDVGRAISALAGRCDMVFIDTAGRSQRDESRMDELRRFVDAARPDEIHLVLSLTSEVPALFSVIDRFKALGPNRLVLSKLDEAERGGAILQCAARSGLPVSYLTTGQEVPSDIELADSRRLAALVMQGPVEAAEIRRTA